MKKLHHGGTEERGDGDKTRELFFFPVPPLEYGAVIAGVTIILLVACHQL